MATVTRIMMVRSVGISNYKWARKWGRSNWSEQQDEYDDAVHSYMIQLAWFIIILSFAAISVSGQVVDSNDILQQEYLWKKQSFLILKTTRDYNEAKVFAAKALKLLNAGSDDRDLQHYDGLGLTLPKSVCLEEGDTYPCYVARGRDGEDSLWASVDLSSAYTGFAKGYFIVILAHGKPESPFLLEALDRARKFFPDAYLRPTEVYVGCMH